MDQHLNDRLAALEKRVYQLEGEVRRLRDALVVRNVDTPTPPVDFPNTRGPFTPGVPVPMNPAPWTGGPVQHCGACGIALERVMSYSCPRANCPTGMGGVHCGGGR